MTCDQYHEKYSGLEKRGQIVVEPVARFLASLEAESEDLIKNALVDEKHDARLELIDQREDPLKTLPVLIVG